jgi:hypothetical protein
MKKGLLAIFTFLYISISAGANMHLHECIDLATTCLSDEHSDNNNRIPCSNDPEQCKLDIQRKINESLVKSSRITREPLKKTFAGCNFFTTNAVTKKISVASSFILTNKPPLFILHRVFRI